MMFGQVQMQVPTDRISCRFHLKWKNCDGIHLAIGEQSRWIYNRCADGRGVITPGDVLVLEGTSRGD